MARTLSDKINKLFEREAWQEAEKALEKALAKSPRSHWVLTQLAVARYEQRRYREALDLLRQSAEIVPDCPLTIWNLAGTLDALCRSEEAIPLYASLLRKKKTARLDPCWESEEWATRLKLDCVYRLGLCHERLGKKDVAEQCFRRYVDLLLSGIDGSYSIEDAMSRIRELQPLGVVAQEVRKAIEGTLRAMMAR